MEGAGELITSFRIDADDAAGSELYATETLYRWASEAEREACMRARLIWDDSSDFLTITLVAGATTYELDPLILHIDRVLSVPASGRAKQIGIVGIDRLHDWPAGCTGQPSSVAHINQALRLFPTPPASYAGTLKLSAYRLPLLAMESEDDPIEIHPQHHDGLVDWMLYRAYSVKDSELEDPSRAQAALERFEGRFGKRRSADAYRRHNERRRVTTRYGGIV